MERGKAQAIMIMKLKKIISFIFSFTFVHDKVRRNFSLFQLLIKETFMSLCFWWELFWLILTAVVWQLIYVGEPYQFGYLVFWCKAKCCAFSSSVYLDFVY